MNISLLSLLQESRSDPALVTIEATVVTGFEPVAAEECKEKISEIGSTTLARGRLFFNIPLHKLNIVEELRSVDNLYTVMKVVPSLHLSCTSIDHDMNILKGEIEHDDLKKAVDVWCERNKFQGILYPTEHGYKAAKDAEVEIKKVAKTLAEARIRDNKCHPVGICDGNYENDSHSLASDSKDERARLNAAEFEAYHEIDSRKPEDKVLKFRVTCVRNGTHCFGSQDAAYHVGGRLQDMFHWIVDLNFYDLEIMLTIKEDSMYCGIALTKESKHHRNINFFGPTTLRATICYNMLRLAQPKAGDVIIDPMCGGGSIPIEPFGKRSGSVFDNRTLYKRVLLELARIVRSKTGRAILLTCDTKSMTLALTFAAGLWKLVKKLKINIGGLEAGVYVLCRLKTPAELLQPVPKIRHLKPEKQCLQ